MEYRILANLVVIFHFAFIVFAVLGAILIYWRRWWLCLHIPAVCWAIYIECSHGICPLTPLEKSLRLSANQAGYSGGFVEHYMIPLIYPAGLTADIQLWLALFVLVINVTLYAGVFIMRAKKKRSH